jgi:VanZ family protein
METFGRLHGFAAFEPINPKAKTRNPKPELLLVCAASKSESAVAPCPFGFPSRKLPVPRCASGFLGLRPSAFLRPSDFGLRTSPCLCPPMGSPKGPSISVAVTRSPLLPFAVLRLRSFCKYWLPVLVWMGIIFSGSSDSGSFQHSSRIIGPLMRWLFPHLSDEAVHAAVVFVRKCAHLTEYAVLALLLWRARRGKSTPGNAPWRWSKAGVVLALVALYAASDEIHQAFVPSREGRVLDVLLDTTGAACGLLCLWGIGRLRKRW